MLQEAETHSCTVRSVVTVSVSTRGRKGAIKLDAEINFCCSDFFTVAASGSWFLQWTQQKQQLVIRLCSNYSYKSATNGRTSPNKVEAVVEAQKAERC